MELEKLREDIKKADQELAEIFIRRMETVRKIAEYKKERGLEIEDKDQEHTVIDNGAATVEDAELRTFFVPFLHSVLDVSKKWQRHLMDGHRVAYCGGMDPKDYTAAGYIFPDSELVAYQNYEKTYNAVVDGECDVAVVPFEKSQTGEVSKVLDLLFAGNLYVNNIVRMDNGSDIVRYAVLSRIESVPVEKTDKLCFLLMFTVSDETGSLVKAISAISGHGYNMRIMRSRPMANLPWHYYFYVEAEGDYTTEDGQKMIEELQAATQTLKVLGRYHAN